MPDAAAPQRYRRGSLGWFEAKLLRGDGESVALFLHCGRELSRPPGVGNLAGHAKLFTELRLLHDGAHVRGDMFSKCRGHAVRPKKANEPIKRQLRKARLADGRHLGIARRPDAVGRREHFYFPAWSCGRSVASDASVTWIRPVATSLAASCGLR